MAVLVTLLGLVIALLAVLVAGLLRSHAEILRSLHELGVDLDPDSPAASRPRGVTVPRPRDRESDRVGTDVTGVTPRGDAVSIAVAGARHSTLVAFLTTGCSTCADFWTAFSDARRLQVPGDARVVVVTKGEEAESPARLRKFVLADVPVVMSSEAWKAYDVPVAPYFALVDGPTSQVVGEGAAATWDHLAQMMEQALADAGFTRPTSPRRRRDGRSREANVDAQLAAAGIEPGDSSLYPQQEGDLQEPEASE
ncbi:MAG: hypothetical protein WEC34_14250 [Acidimicrobiia bacterium]